MPSQHPDLGLPADVGLWSADDCLRYLVRYGWNAVGHLIVGDGALRLHLQSLQNQLPNASAPLAAKRRRLRYPALAEDVLAGAPAGSSAAGEHPKFLTTRMPGPTQVTKVQQLTAVAVTKHLI